MKETNPYPFARLKLVVGGNVLQNVTVPKKEVSAKLHFWRTAFGNRGKATYIDIKPMKTLSPE